MDGMLHVDMTIEQAAAMRIILKVSHIYAIGEFMRRNENGEFFDKLQSYVGLTDKWACLERPFAIALHNKIYNGPADEALSLDTSLTIRMSPEEREVLGEILNDTNFATSLKNTKDNAPGWFKGFISVVVVERNIEALQSIFSNPVTTNAPPPPFWFQQQATKEIN